MTESEWIEYTSYVIDKLKTSRLMLFDNTINEVKEVNMHGVNRYQLHTSEGIWTYPFSFNSKSDIQSFYDNTKVI